MLRVNGRAAYTGSSFLSCNRGDFFCSHRTTKLTEKKERSHGWRLEHAAQSTARHHAPFRQFVTIRICSLVCGDVSLALGTSLRNRANF